MKIPFNKPYMTGDEVNYITDAVNKGHISGNGSYSKACQQLIEERFGTGKCLLTTSCTDALEMSALLLNIKQGDEVIMPSFTFVSTANAFVLRGATIRFCDSYDDNPNIDPARIAKLITPKTRAIVVVHYAGVACDMDPIMKIAEENNLAVIEDAAQGIKSYYKGKALGTIGDLGAFSFHETKNIQCGEGGALLINRSSFNDRAEIIWEKGTNRTAFFRGEVNKYGWVDMGSSFLPSELNAAFLMAQLEQMEDIQNKRKHIWDSYYEGLHSLHNDGHINIPSIPDFATNNAHMFYFTCKSIDERGKLLEDYKEHGIHAVFHYQSLHDSDFYKSRHDGRELPNCDRFASTLVRLPLFYELTDAQLEHIIGTTLDHFNAAS